MAEDETPEPKKLHGAAAAAAAKKQGVESPAPTTSLDAFLKSLSTDLDARIEEAQAVYDAKRLELDEAGKNLRMVKALKGLQTGEFTLTMANEPEEKPKTQRASSGPRAPRGQVAGEILELLKAEGPDGLNRNHILTKLEAKGDAARESSISNSLVALKKSGKISHSKDGFYSLPV